MINIKSAFSVYQACIDILHVQNVLKMLNKSAEKQEHMSVNSSRIVRVVEHTTDIQTLKMDITNFPLRPQRTRSPLEEKQETRTSVIPSELETTSYSANTEDKKESQSNDGEISK